MEQIENAVFNKRMASVIEKQFKIYLKEKNIEDRRLPQRLSGQLTVVEKKIRNVSDILANGIEQGQRRILMEKLEKLDHERVGVQGKSDVEKMTVDLEAPSKGSGKNASIRHNNCFMTEN